MKELKVTRFDGKYFICTDKDNAFFAIEKAEMPTEVKNGDVIVIDNEGNISLKVDN